MTLKTIYRQFLHCLLIIFISALLMFSCGTGPSGHDHETDADNQRQHVSGSLAEEIRSLTETGVLSSMLQALELIRSRELGTVEFGRMMNGINTLIIRLVYPDTLARLPQVDLPQTFNYTRIIREAERGNYISPPEDSTDFFEHILPFFAVTNQINQELLPKIIKDLETAAEIRPNSVLPLFFRGLLHEKLRQWTEAERFYTRTYSLSNECYPALTGIARVRRLSGRFSEAAAQFSDLIVRYPDSKEIKRELALSHYGNRDWARSLPIIDEILLADPRDGEFILMKAYILLEQGQFPRANTTLDSYAPINPNNRLYLFLRARVQNEGSRNRDSALNYLRSILRSSPNDEEALIYAAALLLESSRAADQTEGRDYLERLRRLSGSSIPVLNLSLRDAVMRESWQEAQGFLNRILATRRTIEDLIDGYHIERGLGNNTRALNFARELYERDTSNNDHAVIYISALIDNGRRDEASRLLENRINLISRETQVSRGRLLSSLYFQRSRLHTNDEAALSDLRLSQFEDPRNLDPLIAMFEIYIRRREERRAVIYLRQALAIAPDNPRLRRYELEYASLLGRN